MSTWREMSQDCLQVAKLLLTESQWRSSINRSYYAAYCALSHALIHQGVRFPHGWNNPTHEQLPALVRNGLPLSQPRRRPINQALRRLRYAREDSDYRPMAFVTKTVAMACIHDAELIVEIMEEEID